jgi:hypothetical protein
MLLHLTEDEHGWVVVPHSTEPECWDTTPEGSVELKKSGWKAHVMHRVSRYVIDSLIIDGLLLAFKPLETPSSLRETQTDQLAPFSF